MKIRIVRLIALAMPWISLMSLSACSTSQMRPINDFNLIFSQSSKSSREPVLGQRWLITLSKKNGNEKIELIDLRKLRRVDMPGINRADSQPISISMSANGDRIAFIRQRADQTELLLYRRKLGILKRVDIEPKGVPRRVSLNATGTLLAVQVSRAGRWDVDLIRLGGRD